MDEGIRTKRTGTLLMKAAGWSSPNAHTQTEGVHKRARIKTVHRYCFTLHQPLLCSHHHNLSLDLACLRPVCNGPLKSHATQRPATHARGLTFKK